MLTHHSAAPALPKRTVVIGSGGFVGGELVRRLHKVGGAVHGVARKDVDLLAPDASEKLKAHLRPGDAVVAVSAMAPCKNVAMLVDNVRLTQAITDAIASVDVAHVINVSSDAVYGDEPLPLTEAAPAAPESLHGVMHLARELVFTATIKAPLAIVRPSLLYGASDPHNGYGPNRFRRLAAKGDDIVLFGEGEERRDHVLIDDVAEVIFRILARASTGKLNIATGQVTSFKSIAEQVVKIAGSKSTIKGSPRIGPMPHKGYRPFCIDAALAAFPDFSYTPIAEGLKKAQADMQG
jgi:UDP-glucose 4-epimerase